MSNGDQRLVSCIEATCKILHKRRWSGHSWTSSFKQPKQGDKETKRRPFSFDTGSNISSDENAVSFHCLFVSVPRRRCLWSDAKPDTEDESSADGKSIGTDDAKYAVGVDGRLRTTGNRRDARYLHRKGTNANICPNERRRCYEGLLDHEEILPR